MKNSETKILYFPHCVAAARIENAAAWKYEQFTLIEEIFRQINYVVITLESVARKFKFFTILNLCALKDY